MDYIPIECDATYTLEQFFILKIHVKPKLIFQRHNVPGVHIIIRCVI